jgi:hypothetical protein
MHQLDARMLRHGYTTTNPKGDYAEFYPDGQIARFGRTTTEGDTLTLFLEPARQGGRVERTLHFREQEDIGAGIFEYDEEPDQFGNWVSHWVDEIYTFGRKGFFCSFCGKGQHEVTRLIAGPQVLICNECVALCNEILTEESGSSQADGE